MALKSGDIGAVSNLNLIPYQGQLYTPSELERVITGMQQVPVGAPAAASRRAYTVKKVKKAKPGTEGRQALEAISGQ